MLFLSLVPGCERRSPPVPRLASFLGYGAAILSPPPSFLHSPPPDSHRDCLHYSRHLPHSPRVSISRSLRLGGGGWWSRAAPVRSPRAGEKGAGTSGPWRCPGIGRRWLAGWLSGGGGGRGGSLGGIGGGDPSLPPVCGGARADPERSGGDAGV